MSAAVTGGTGHLGQALVRLLVRRPEVVRVLVRRAEADAAIRSLGAEPVRGDLTLASGCDGFVRAGDVVYHLAARVSAVGRWADFHRTTVEGTRRLLAAALPCGPGRFVYVSSGAVYSPKHTHGGVSADRTPASPDRHNLYARAKLEAEHLVRTECERAGCAWTIVRLGCILYGPGLSPLIRTLVPLAERGRLAVIGDGRNRIATLYVDDAAWAVLLAGTHPAAGGKVYDVASDDRVTQRQLLDATSDALSVPRPRRRVGRRAAYVAAALAELWARIIGREPLFSRSLIVLMSTDQVVDATRIRNELGWQPAVGFEDGMERMREWHEELSGEGDGAGGAAEPNSPRLVGVASEHESISLTRHTGPAASLRGRASGGREWR